MIKRGKQILVITVFFVFSLSFVCATTSIMLNGTEGGDAYVKSDSKDTNFGSEIDLHVKNGLPKKFSYLIFNISAIPSNQIIDSAELCLYLSNDQGDQSTGVYHVYSGFDESTITWNNQPCGISFDNSANCNLTAESILQLDGTKDETWQCWSVKNMLDLEYISGNKNISIALYTTDSGDADLFYSKEYVDSSLWPFLNVTYHTADATPPSISIIYPANNSNYSTNSVNVNYTVSDAALQSCWWTNNSGIANYSVSCGENLTTFVWVEGVNNIAIWANDTNGNMNSSSVSFFVDTIGPTITIIHPESGKTYGTNTSLPLNFSINDEGVGVNSCWYNVDSGANTILPSCGNTTFNVTGEGSHNVSLFANDSLGNVNSKNVTFSVVTTAPALNLLYPSNNSYINYQNNIYFNYSVESGVSLSACQFWVGTNGTLQLNQTNNSVSTGNNFFILNLSEGQHDWGIVCNDTQNRASGVNYTFEIDTVYPSLSLTQPSGTKTSRTGVPLTFSVSDINMESCWYNVYRGVVLEKSGLANCSSGSGSFDVTVDADFVLSFYVNDSAGNSVNANSSFTVDTSTIPVTPPSGGGGGGGGGGSLPIISNGTREIKVEFSNLEEVVLKRGTSEKIELSVTSKDIGFLNNCGLVFEGKIAGWLSNSQTKGLSKGEKYIYNIDLKIPATAEPGTYLDEIVLKCEEGEVGTILRVTTYRENFEAEILEYERLGDELRVTYSLTENSGESHDILINYSMSDFDGVIRTTGQEPTLLGAKEKTEKILVFKLPKDSFGEFNFVMVLSNGVSTVSTEKQIFLPSGSVGGFAIFEGGNKTLSWIGVGVVLIIMVIFVGRFIWKHNKRSKYFWEGWGRRRKRKLLDFDL